MLSGRLARRFIERWAVRLAKWLDRAGTVASESQDLGPALRLFGLERFRDGQLDIVQAALSGQSLLVISPTGYGKTVCFQLPGVLRAGVSVVISPLKALMGDQVSHLLRRKIPATFINSDLSNEEKETRYDLLSKSAFKFLYAAPERFFVRTKSELQKLRAMKPAFIVVDEAHCVDQWGRDFRPEYGRLREIRAALGSPPVLAFTATAGLEMQQRILESLGIADAKVFLRDVDRPNITLLRWEAREAERMAVIERLCRVRLPGPGKMMVFVPTRKIGEELKRHLADRGLDVPFYHSQMGTPWDRENFVKRFVGEAEPALDRVICTNAFGMGLDVPNVRLVVHWQHPSSAEDYLQEFGRAGRDGRPSVAVLLCDPQKENKDLGLLRYMAKKSVENVTPSDQEAALDHRTRQIDAMSQLALHQGCFRDALLSYFSASSGPPSRSIALWLLEFVFAKRSRAARSKACCDFCAQRQIIARGKVEFVQSVLGLG